jgi:hypothetical protein
MTLMTLISADKFGVAFVITGGIWDGPLAVIFCAAPTALDLRRPYALSFTASVMKFQCEPCLCDSRKSKSADLRIREFPDAA